MTETVTSKFRNSLLIAPLFFCLLMFGLITLCVELSATSDEHNNAGEIMGTIAAIVILGYYNTNHAIKRFIKVTVSPDGLVLNYLLINKKITVNYADLLHEDVFSENTDGTGAPPTLIDTVKLKIELNNGENLYLYKEYYENFEDLAESIRRARFKLE